MNKTLILIDGRSAHAMSRALEKSIDFKKLVDHIKTLYSLDAEDIVASVYLNNTVDGENTAARKLYDWLGNNGFDWGQSGSQLLEIVFLAEIGPRKLLH